MDYEGNSIANTADLTALEARVTTLEGEVATLTTNVASLTTDVNNIDLSLDSLQVAGTMASPATTVTLTALIATNITPTLKGSPFVPDTLLVDNMAFRIRVYGHLTTPSANNLAIWISTTNDTNNPLTSINFFGLPVYLTSTSIIFEFNITFNTKHTGSGATIAYFNPPFVNVSPDFSVNPSSIDLGLNFYLCGQFQNSAGSSLVVEMMTIEQIAGWF